jgi:hypothetical protein
MTPARSAPVGPCSATAYGLRCARPDRTPSYAPLTSIHHLSHAVDRKAGAGHGHQVLAYTSDRRGAKRFARALRVALIDTNEAATKAL